MGNAVEASGSEAEPVVVRVVEEGERLCFEVVDQGSGMTKEQLLRVKEPFFSTKAEGEGMGMGLFFAEKVATQFGGELVVESVEGKGTMVRFSLRKEVDNA